MLTLREVLSDFLLVPSVLFVTTLCVGYRLFEKQSLLHWHKIGGAENAGLENNGLEFAELEI